MSAVPISLKAKALSLLRRREHSRVELERKLARFEQEPGSLSSALDELQQKGFINEARVVDSVLHQRASRLGAARIQQELQNKGIDPQAVRDAVASLQGSELERARAVWAKKFGGPPQSPAERARQLRFLAARGFADAAGRQVVPRVTLPESDLAE